MIFYFSGTGNSRTMAESLASKLNESLRFIPDENPLTEKFEGETLGFVFPVYSWGVPPLVTDFISALPEEFVDILIRKEIFIWSVMTCGDEVALAPEMLMKTLCSRDLHKVSIWSVTMPNNYVLLPGFDVDPKELEKKKLQESAPRIMQISSQIKARKQAFDVTRGKWASLKSRIVFPLFKKWGIDTKKWHHTDACVSCGICAKRCPLHNIDMQDGFPRWGTNCCSCLACYHSCPRHAVAYGKATERKGQYFMP